MEEVAGDGSGEIVAVEAVGEGGEGGRREETDKAAAEGNDDSVRSLLSTAGNMIQKKIDLFR